MCLPALKNGRKYGNIPRYRLYMVHNHILCVMFAGERCQSGRISGDIGGSGMESDAEKADSLCNIGLFFEVSTLWKHGS